jgi:hypothetical protein
LLGSKFFVDFISVSMKAIPPNNTSPAAVLFGTADVCLAAIGLNEGQLS